jgi:hypothetical protein
MSAITQWINKFGIHPWGIHTHTHTHKFGLCVYMRVSQIGHNKKNIS